LQKTAVLKKATPEDRAVGVVSTSPWQVMNPELNEQHPSDTQPIALSGTAMVKVSTANGHIKKGDLLTASSLPGVAVRTDKAGSIIGSALEDYPSTSTSTSESLLENDSATSTPQILMFISTTYSTGSRTKAVLANYGVDMDTIPAEVDRGRLLLAQLISTKKEITASSTLSEIYTDRVMAALEIISPRVLTETLVVNAIEPFDKNVTFKIAEGGKLVFIRAGPDQMSMTFGTGPPTASSTPILVIDDLGNALFTGAITVGTKEKPSGITLYDTDTGEPYCVRIAQGALVHVAGACIIADWFGTSTSTPAELPTASEVGPSPPTTEVLLEESVPPPEELPPAEEPLIEEPSPPPEEPALAEEPSPPPAESPLPEEPLLEEPSPPPEESPPLLEATEDQSLPSEPLLVLEIISELSTEEPLPEPPIESFPAPAEENPVP
jgi:hypothetical protein